MSRYLLICALVAIFALQDNHASAGYDPQILTTDVLTAVIPLTGLAVAYFSDDVEGQKQWLRNTAVNQILTTALRVGFNETSIGKRPNGHPYGFPSGHQAFITSGAAFLGERYGWKWGAPAYLASAYVGYVRVNNSKHHWRDILASGAISYGVALLTVTPEKATHLAPIIGPDFLGLRWERSF